MRSWQARGSFSIFFKVHSSSGFFKKTIYRKYKSLFDVPTKAYYTYRPFFAKVCRWFKARAIYSEGVWYSHFVALRSFRPDLINLHLMTLSPPTVANHPTARALRAQRMSNFHLYSLS